MVGNNDCLAIGKHGKGELFTMTIRQREHIKHLLDSVLHESDRWEARAERREAEGNMEKVKHCEEKIDICSAKLDIAADILRTLGYSIKYNLETNDYTILGN